MRGALTGRAMNIFNKLKQIVTVARTHDVLIFVGGYVCAALLLAKLTPLKKSVLFYFHITTLIIAT